MKKIPRIRKKKRRTFTEKQESVKAIRRKIDVSIREDLLKILENEIKGFRDIRWISKSKTYNTIKDIKYNLLILIINSYYGHIKKHKTDTEYGSYGWDRLEKNLGKDYRKIISIAFDVKHPGHTHNLVKEHITLKYKLKKEIIDICDRVYNGEIRLHTRIVRGGKKLLDIPKFVVHSVVEGGIVKRNNSNKYRFNSIVQLNEDNILLMVKMWAELYRYKAGKKISIKRWETICNSVGIDINNLSLEQIERRKTHAIELLDKTLVDVIGEGRLLQLYTEKDSGRLYGDNYLNLQTLPKEMRYIAMGGNNYYEYDMENAHYNILYQYNKMVGGNKLEGIGTYVKNTKGIRNTISRETGIDIPIIKRILISLIYGASLEQYHTYDKVMKKSDDNAIMKLLLEYTNENRDDASELFNIIKENKLVSKIYNDIKVGRKTIQQSWVKKRLRNKEVLYNPYGKYINVIDNNGNRKGRGILLSHFLQGIEAALLMFIIEEEQESFIMPHHDGWVSETRWNTHRLENIIKTKSARMMWDYNGINGGFEIVIKRIKINDIEKDDWMSSILKSPSVKTLSSVK